MNVVEWVLALVASGLGLAAGVSAARDRQPAAGALITVWVIAFCAFAATLPALPSPPFTAGGQLGIGLLLGSGLWVVAVFLGIQERFTWVAIALPLLAPGLALVLVPAGPLPMLIGVLIATAIAWCCLGRFWSVLAPLAVALFAFASALGLAFETAPPRGVQPEAWHLVPVLIALAGYGAVLTVRSGALERAPRLGVHLATGAWLIAGALIARTCGASDLWQVALAVVVATSIVGLLAPEESARGLAVLVWIGIFAFAFTAERGYGTANAALMLSLYTLALAQREPTGVRPDSLLSGAALLTLAGLFRLFIETYPLRAPRADLYTHYTFIGFLLAVAVLANLARWWHDEAPAARALVAGFWAAGAPVALAAVWGVRAAAGWLAGGLATAVVVSIYATSKQNRSSVLAPVFAGVAAILPGVALVDPLSDAPRTTRIWVLLALALGFALSLAIEPLFNRMSARQVPGRAIENS